ncbi:MAG: A/G-specific adenine glycosylase [Spirochaetota bacterium]
MDTLLDTLLSIQESYYDKKKIGAAIKKKFLSCIYDFYDNNYRNLPWRNTDNPYHILVSEVMLQQTQVSRVIDKYLLFIKKFPTIEALAHSSLYDVLVVWQGLGYNRRAKYLVECARVIAEQYNGVVPNTLEQLQKLPGLGKATAASVSIFAYNQPYIYIETNVRAVYIYTFFAKQEKITDAMIVTLLKQTMDRKNPKKFYNALMDCGTYIKRHYNFSRHSAHYTVQTPYATSLRKVRGSIVRYLVTRSAAKKEEIMCDIGVSSETIEKALDALCSEGLVCEEKGIYKIAPK